MYCMGCNLTDLGSARTSCHNHFYYPGLHFRCSKPLEVSQPDALKGQIILAQDNILG